MRKVDRMSPFHFYSAAAPSFFAPNCKIDMLGVWDRVLSESELVSLYNGGNGMEYPFTTKVP